jgi:hypothetical protein
MRRCGGAPAALQCCTPPARTQAHAFRAGVPLRERAAAPQPRGPRRMRRAPHRTLAAGWLAQPPRVVIRRVHAACGGALRLSESAPFGRPHACALVFAAATI